MQISKIGFCAKNSTNKQQKVNNSNNFSSFNTINLNNNPISQLNKELISFCGMKKSQFSGIDLIMINYLTKTKGLNIQSKNINSNSDFQNYCKNILNSEFYGEDNIKKLSNSIDSQAQIQKEAILKEWIEYISKENDAYNPAIQLMIISSITKNLSFDTNHLPPILDKRKVADTIQEISNNSKTIKNYEPNFDKMYRANLQKTMLKSESKLDSSLNGWIIIPSKTHDPKNFSDNVKKLQTLSHDSWCTKTYNAQPYLAKGDFHIYFEQGKAKLGVRFNGDEIVEIQGEKNNNKIPLNYLDMFRKYVQKNNYPMNENAKQEVQKTQELQREIAKIKKELGRETLQNKEYDKILTYFGIEVEKDEDGMLILSKYNQPSDDISFEDLGINENDLFRYVKEIKGDVIFKNSALTSLGALKTIGGSAYFYNSKITSLGNLQSIRGNADFRNSNMVSLGNLKSIGGDTYFACSKITSLGNLEFIGGDAHFGWSKITSLGDLLFIGGTAYFEGSEIVSLENLQYIEGSAYFKNSNVVSMGDLKSIKGNAYFQASKVTSLGNLEFIGGYTFIRHSNLKKDDFKNIKIGISIIE